METYPNEIAALEIAYEYAGRGTAEEAAYFEAKARYTERRMHFGVEIPATTTGVY
jgi:hypothetical protein